METLSNPRRLAWKSKNRRLQNTPVKIEVGAIGEDDNATFSEIFDICVNEVAGCGEE